MKGFPEDVGKVAPEPRTELESRSRRFAAGTGKRVRAQSARIQVVPRTDVIVVRPEPEGLGRFFMAVGGGAWNF